MVYIAFKPDNQEQKDSRSKIWKYCNQSLVYTDLSVYTFGGRNPRRQYRKFPEESTPMALALRRADEYRKENNIKR